MNGDKTIITTNKTKRGSNRLGRFLGDWSFYGLVLVLGKTFNLIQLLILASYLTIEDFGQLDFFLTISSVLTVLLIFGQDSAVARLYFEKNSASLKKSLVSQSLAFQFVFYLCLVLLFGLGISLFDSLENLNDSAPSILVALIIQLPFLMFIDFSISLLKWTRQKRRYVSLTVLYSISQIIFIIIAIFSLKLTLKNIIFVYVTCNIIFGVFSIYLIRENLVIPKKFNDLRDLIYISAPIGLLCIAISASPIIERSLVSGLLGYEALGEYSFATRLTLVLWVAYTAFSNAWGPFAIRIYKGTSSAKTFNLILKLLTSSTGIFAFLLVCFGKILTDYFGLYAYEEAFLLIFPLAMAAGVHALSGMVEFSIFISKKNFPRLVIITISLSTLILSVSLLASDYGTQGIAWCVLFAALIRLLLTYIHILSQKRYGVQWKPAFMMKILGLSIALGAALQFIYSADSDSLLFISSGINIFIIIIISYLFFTRIDRSITKIWIRAVLGSFLENQKAGETIGGRHEF